MYVNLVEVLQFVIALHPVEGLHLGTALHLVRALDIVSKVYKVKGTGNSDFY